MKGGGGELFLLNVFEVPTEAIEEIIEKIFGAFTIFTISKTLHCR